MSHELAVVSLDTVGLRNIRRIAGEMDLQLVEFAALSQIDTMETEPLGTVIELELPEALAAIASCKERWPKALVAGFLTIPDADLWREAEDAGCDVVTTRGALKNVLPDRLRRWIEQPGGRRLRLFPMGDIAGRLGVVQRIEDSPVGPLAIYHIAGQVLAIGDACPHAGARLSHGPLDMDTACVTCPEHGSQFDARTGDRLRGPSDDPVRSYPVLVEDGTAYAHLD